MSHFTVMVIGDNPEKQLEPFNENIEVERYVQNTKEQLIKNGKDEIERYKKDRYTEYLKDPIKYGDNCSRHHLKYISEEFPKKLKWNDHEIYLDAIKYEEPDNLTPEGGIYSTYKSKWDWYLLGGRWSGLIKLKKGANGVVGSPGTFNNETGIDQAKKEDITNLDELVTFAVLKDGEWYERGEMGWWGCVSNEKAEEEWGIEQKKLISELSNDILISIYDCHI